MLYTDLQVTNKSFKQHGITYFTSMVFLFSLYQDITMSIKNNNPKL